MRDEISPANPEAAKEMLARLMVDHAQFEDPYPLLAWSTTYLSLVAHTRRQGRTAGRPPARTARTTRTTRLR